GRARSFFGMVTVAAARPSGAGPVVPAKITSSILPPRSAFAPCSPRTQAIASTTFDLPEPFGPTTQVIPGSKRRVVADAKDLKPFSVRLLRCTDLRIRGRQAGRHGEGPVHLTLPRRRGRGTRGRITRVAAECGRPSTP